MGGWIGCRRHGIPLPAFADAVAPGLVLAQAIGRLGNYFNQELYGRETTLPWGLEIFYRRDPSGYVDPHSLDGVSTGQVALVVQPTFLYELIWNVLVFAILIYADRRFALGHGRLFALYVASYCIGRFGVELLRDDTATHIAGIRINSFTSTFVFIGAVVYIMVAPKGREAPESLRGKEAEESAAEEPADELAAVAAGSSTAAGAAGTESADAAETDKADAAEEADEPETAEAETVSAEAAEPGEAEAEKPEAETEEVDEEEPQAEEAEEADEEEPEEAEEPEAEDAEAEEAEAEDAEEAEEPEAEEPEAEEPEAEEPEAAEPEPKPAQDSAEPASAAEPYTTPRSRWRLRRNRPSNR
ncbi:prolipoprotein diacylglyceryl transferase family protein [Mycobacterium sp. E3305]|uniref:prolipoprotein diacylglyceryl transferase family protein n=1 Tax=Mycobacterium sp. E3305 TaxID=1834145 RepID=UPI000AB8EBE4